MKRIFLAVCLLVAITSMGIAQTKPVASASKKEVRKAATAKPATASTEKKATTMEKKHHKKKASHTKEVKKS